jgi:WD40-like Beta Propeller Repeat
MPKAWPSLVLGWIVVLAANGCSADQRLLGRISTLLSDAGSSNADAADADAGDAESGDADGGDASAEAWVPFGAVTLFAPLASLTASQADPTMTADELELYFSSNPKTDWDIWLVQRPSKTGAWGTPSKVVELSSAYLDETPEVSADGLTIYLASERPPGSLTAEHLWVSHRKLRTDAWDPPVQVTDFVGGDKDVSPSLQEAQLVMVFASLHGSDWDLYQTTRASTNGLWGTPTPLTELNSPQFDWDPALYQDGRSIVFASRRLNTTNSLFYASRLTVTDKFSTPQPATELNVNDDADPWLSNDGTHIVFDSRRAGAGNGPIKIYEAYRQLP